MYNNITLCTQTMVLLVVLCTIVLHHVLKRWSSWSFYVQYYYIMFSNDDLVGRFMYNFITSCTQMMI